MTDADAAEDEDTLAELVHAVRTLAIGVLVASAGLALVALVGGRLVPLGMLLVVAGLLLGVAGYVELPTVE